MPSRTLMKFRVHAFVVNFSLPIAFYYGYEQRHFKQPRSVASGTLRDDDRIKHLEFFNNLDGSNRLRTEI